jgi:hypothetical protein
VRGKEQAPERSSLGKGVQQRRIAPAIPYLNPDERRRGEDKEQMPTASLATLGMQRRRIALRIRLSGAPGVASAA